MSHHVYTTSGFIIDEKHNGEANKLFYIFTRDLGLVIAAAQGIRHLKSKLRYSMDAFSYGHFSLVRGKDIWRITGAQEGEVWFKKIRGNRTLFVLYVQILNLLKRLLNGEEKHEALFDTIENGFIFLAEENTQKKNKEGKGISQEELLSFEYILVSRILFELGYMNPDESTVAFVSKKEWSVELLAQSLPYRRTIISLINAALAASQL